MTGIERLYKRLDALWLRYADLEAQQDECEDEMGELGRSSGGLGRMSDLKLCSGRSN